MKLAEYQWVADLFAEELGAGNVELNGDIHGRSVALFLTNGKTGDAELRLSYRLPEDLPARDDRDVIVGVMLHQAKSYLRD